MKYSLQYSMFIAALAAVIISVGPLVSSNTASAQESPAMAQRIERLEAAIKPGDASGHQRLANFLYNNRLYHQALTQVNEALKIEPGFQNAQLLKNLIDTALRQQRAAANIGPASTTSSPGSRSPRMTAPMADGQTLLTMKDVYKIRLWQLRRHETAPIEGRILHRRKTLISFWRNVILRNPIYQNTTLTRKDYEQFISPNNLDRQIYLIRRLGTQKYWDKVQIKSDPELMKIFRTDIQPIALQSCATIGCHRGQNAPGFRLYEDQGQNSVRKTYTNFLTLTRFRYDNMPLISLRNPHMSLLLQYLQPKELQAYAHPGKRGPVMRTFNQNVLLNWIESLRYPPRSYGLGGRMPATTSAATKPAARPAQ